MVLPAVITIGIFKLFPDTKVSASGPFQNLTVNVTGAFGAFFITLLAGWVHIDRIDARIQESLVAPTWEVTTMVKFLDTEGKEIKIDRALREDLRVFIKPSITTNDLPFVSIRLPLVKPGAWPTLHFDLPGFLSDPISPRRMIESKLAKVDSLHQSVDLGELVMRQAPAEEVEELENVVGASAAGAYLKSVPDGPPAPTSPVHRAPTISLDSGLTNTCCRCMDRISLLR